MKRMRFICASELRGKKNKAKKNIIASILEAAFIDLLIQERRWWAVSLYGGFPLIKQTKSSNSV